MADPMDFLAEPRVFVRVYRLPPKLTAGYCFGGGVPITFVNVDWFEAPENEGQDGLVRFVKTKRYYSNRDRFLVIGDKPQFTFTIEPTP